MNRFQPSRGMSSSEPSGCTMTRSSTEAISSRRLRGFPPLAAVADMPAVGTSATTPRREPRERTRDEAADGLGMAYRPAAEDVATSTRNPWTVDPDVVDRGLRGHATIQNSLAEYVRSRGGEPRSPRPNEPQFDLAWEREGVTFVVEVKSLTKRNEEQQLRLGLGQVLRYQHLLASRGDTIRAHLVVEREPTDGSRATLCEALAVVLAWPPIFGGVD